MAARGRGVLAPAQILEGTLGDLALELHRFAEQVNRLNQVGKEVKSWGECVGPFVEGVRTYQECHARVFVPKPQVCPEDDATELEGQDATGEEEDEEERQEQQENDNTNNEEQPRKRWITHKQEQQRQHESSAREQQDGGERRKKVARKEALPKHVAILRKATRGKLSPKYKLREHQDRLELVFSAVFHGPVEGVTLRDLVRASGASVIQSTEYANALMSLGLVLRRRAQRGQTGAARYSLKEAKPQTVRTAAAGAASAKAAASASAAAAVAKPRVSKPKPSAAAAAAQTGKRSVGKRNTTRTTTSRPTQQKTSK